METWQDKFCIGTKKNCVSEYSFASATTGNGFFGDAGGKIGYGLGKTNVLNELYLNKAISAPKMTFYMGQVVDDVKLRVGEEDDALFKEAGKAKVNPFTDSTDWHLTASDLKLGTESFNAKDKIDVHF